MEVLNEIASLDDPLAEVQGAVQRVVAAQQPGSDPLTRADALSSLERATETWLDASERVESVLLRYVRSGDPEQAANDRREKRSGDPEQAGSDRSEDTADAVERLGGVSLIHLAVASDLAKLAPIDALGDSDPVSAAGPVPESVRPSAIQAAAGDGPDEGRVRRAITLPVRQADDEDDDDLVGPSPHLTARDVLKELVDSAGGGARSALVGIAPSPHVVFLAVKPALETVMGLAPDVIARAAKDAVRSVGRLARMVLRRVRDVINEVTQGHFEVVSEFLVYAQPQELVLGPAVRAIVARILKEERISSQIAWVEEIEPAIRILSGQPAVPRLDHTDALRKILKHNARWVGRPVPILARTLHPLWAVPIGPVPAAPIAASLLLAWTILFTGDQLDAPGAFPNFWHPGLMNLI